MKRPTCERCGDLTIAGRLCGGCKLLESGGMTARRSRPARRARPAPPRLAAVRTDVDRATDAAPPLAFRYRSTGTPAAVIPPAVYELSNGRCDCCCAAIADGARTLAYWEESAAGVRVALLHAERCPNRCSALETRPIPDPDRPGGVLYEMSLCPRDAVSAAEDGTGRCDRHQDKELASG